PRRRCSPSSDRCDPRRRSVGPLVVCRSDRSIAGRRDRHRLAAGLSSSDALEMTAAALLLAAWLTPAVWLSIPTLIVDRGPNGLWGGLALIVGPLGALGVTPSRWDDNAGGAGFPGVALLVTGGILFWANLSLAGDVSVWLGWPRWHGIVIAAVGACLLAVMPGAGRVATVLLLVAALSVSVPLLDLARASGIGPIGAWDRVANRTA